MRWLGPFLFSVETGGWFQSPSVPSKSNSYLRSNDSSVSWCDGFRWEQLSLTLAGASALSYLASSISHLLLVAFRVLTGSWARQLFCLRAVGMLGLSCTNWQYSPLAGGYSLWLWFSFEIQTVPMSYKLCQPMNKLYIGALALALYSTIRCQINWLASRVFLQRRY